MAKNICLHFLNKASGDLYGLMGRSKNAHIDALVEAINVAVFICRDYCVMPPLFIAECPRAQRAIVRRMGYCFAGLIRISMREKSFEEYFAKKDEEIPDYRDQYGDLFDENTRRFVKRQKDKVFLLDRIRAIGNEMAEWWKTGPDEQDGYFREIIDQLRMGSSVVEDLRNIPTRIRDSRGAVTWPAVKAIFYEKERPPNFAKLQLVVQHSYISQYLSAHDLTILTGLDFDRGIDFGLARGDYSHDWRVVERALQIVGCWEVIKTISADSMYELRKQPGYFQFRNALVSLGESSPNVDAAHHALSLLISRIEGFKAWESLRRDIRKPKAKPTGKVFPNVTVRAIGELFAFAASAGMAELSSTHLLVSAGSKTSSWSGKGRLMAAKKAQHAQSGREAISVAIFCALAEEREYLVKRWKMTPHSNGRHWIGEVEGVPCLLYSANQMGRVPAAITTMKLLTEFDPGQILVLGIAGGFEQEEVKLGDVFVPLQIADLATRKIREKEENVLPEFRPHAYRTNQKLLDYFNSSSFNLSAWEQKAADDAEWPAGLRPRLLHGVTVACTDEVVSSTDWSDQMRKAWAQLKGTEMESGGVCASAEQFKVDVSVIRVVSDLADPAKSDNEWRRRGMKTIATLVEVVLAGRVIP